MANTSSAKKKVRVIERKTIAREMYRNRINTYKKQGFSQKEAENKAFLDFREIAEEAQQSSSW